MTGMNWLQSVNFTVTDYDKYESEKVLYTSNCQWLGYRPTHCNKTVGGAIARCRTSVFLWPLLDTSLNTSTVTSG